MSTISGKDGKVRIGAQDVAEITGWSLSTTSQNSAYASSSTGGYKRRVAGVKDATGNLRFKLDPANPLTTAFDEGDSVTLLLYIDATLFYSVPALIDSVRLEVDIDSGDVVGGTAEFSASGAWTKPAYGGA